MGRTGLLWLKIWTSGGLLWTMWWTFAFHTMYEVSLLAEEDKYDSRHGVNHTYTRVRPRNNQSFFQLIPVLFSHHIYYSLDLSITITYTSHSVQNAFIIPRNIYSSTRPLCAVHLAVLAIWIVPASQVSPASPRSSLVLQSEWPIWPTVPVSVPVFFVVGDAGRTSGPPGISVWYATRLRMCDLLPLHAASWRRGWPFEDVERRSSGGAVRGTTLTLLLLLLLLLRENTIYCPEGSHAQPARPSCKSRLEAG